MAEGDQAVALSQALEELERERARANSLRERLERDRQMTREVRSQRRALRRRGMSMLQATIRRREATVDLFQGASSLSTDESEDESELFDPRSPVSAFFYLSVSNILPAQTSEKPATTSNAEENVTIVINDDEYYSEGEEDVVPFILRELIGKKFRVGPDGATIGCGRGCSIRVPKVSQLAAEHVRIRWCRQGEKTTDTGILQMNVDGVDSVEADSAVDGGMLSWSDLSGHGFHQLVDLTNGQTTAKVGAGRRRSTLSTLRDDQQESPTEEKDLAAAAAQHQVSLPTEVRWPLVFTTGRLEWVMKPMAPHELATACLFAAVRTGQLDLVQRVVEAAKHAGGLSGCGSYAPLVRQSSVLAKKITLDLDEEILQALDDDCSDDDQHPMRSPISPYHGRRGSVARVRLRQRGRFHRQVFGGDMSVGLLQVAVGTENAEVVRFLLAEGADVNRTAGRLQQTALHLAATKGLVQVVRTLLQCGADIDVLDCDSRPAVQLTSSHPVRRLLLNTTLLCSAAEFGDTNEVKQLLDSGTEPNGVGLAQKAALHLACLSGHKAVVDLLISAGACINQRGGSRRRTALHYASLRDHTAVATSLIKAGVAEHIQDSHGYTALNLSSGGAMCRLLHKQPLSLCLAAQGGDVGEARRLLDNNELSEEEVHALVNQRNEENHAPIHLASAGGHLEFVQLLVVYAADVNQRGGGEGWTPLIYSSLAGQSHVVEFLLSVGADPEVCDANGLTAVEKVEAALEKIKDYSAVDRQFSADEGPSTGGISLQPPALSRQQSNLSAEQHSSWVRRRQQQLQLTLTALRSGPQRLKQALLDGDLRIAKSLLDEGLATIGATFECPLHGSALYHACAMGKREFVDFFLDRGASLSAAGEDGLLPAHAAITRGHVDIVKLLLQRGQDLKATDTHEGNSLLHVAAMANQPKIVDVLLQSGADRHASNAHGELPFDIAKQSNVQRLLAEGNQRLLVEARAGAVRRVRELLEVHNVDVQARFHDDTTALHEACRNNQLTVVQVLTEHGADVNTTGGLQEDTALHIAAHLGHGDVVQHLLSCGSRVDVRNRMGQTPFEVARNNAMRKLLIQPRTIHVKQVDEKPEGDLPDNKRCLVCMDKPINTIILPCGHQAFCSDCAARLTDCALDRQPINEIVKVVCS